MNLDHVLVAELTGAVRATVRGERRIEPLEMIGSEVAEGDAADVWQYVKVDDATVGVKGIARRGADYIYARNLRRVLDLAWPGQLWPPPAKDLGGGCLPLFGRRRIGFRSSGG